MEICEYQASDCLEIARLFYETIHNVNAKDYSEDQLDVWASLDKNGDIWHQILSPNQCFVAKKEGKIIGFSDISASNYLNHLYVHKDYQRQGVATALCEKLESDTSITTHASITACPFFEKRAYKLITKQEVERKGIMLVNYLMKKEVE